MPIDVQFPNRTNVPVTPGFPALAPTYGPRTGLTGALDVSGTAYTGVSGSMTITVGGTAAGAGPTVTINVGGTSVTYTYVAGDTTTTLAASHIVAALNGNTTVAGFVTATNAANVITLTAVGTGQSGVVAVTQATTGGATLTFGSLVTTSITVGGTAAGAGPIFKATINSTAVTYSYVAGDTSTAIAAGHIATAINASAVNTLVTASASGSVVTINSTSGVAFTINTDPSTGTGAPTYTVASETDFVSPNIVFPLSTFPYIAPGSMGAITFYQGEPREVDNYTRYDLKVQGLVA